jgi:hypothetical protein
LFRSGTTVAAALSWPHGLECFTLP